VGVYRDEQDAFAQVHRPGRLYKPDPQVHARYREWFAVYEELYPALQSIHAKLHG
jgi:sugar (pentulose or hexulose) kinase